MKELEKLTSYDEVPYESHAFPQSHPNRLAVIGYLFGMNPAPVSHCRVLELGSASGGNIIPMAFYLPESRFVGIDLSAHQVMTGQTMIRELGLTNIRLEHADIADVDTSWGKFDYILCHGVYSWVPDIVRDKIMIIAAANLAPDGIAYISYNTYPGWHLHETFRYAMLYHTRKIRDPWERVRKAKELVETLSRHIPTENNPYLLSVRNDMETIRQSSDSSVFHEHLEDVNKPVYFHQFAEHAERHNLQYLGEADIGSMLTHNFPDETVRDITQISDNVIALEQYMDFLRNRPFRQSLLCHKEVKISRQIDAERLGGLLYSSSLMPESGQIDLSSDKEQIFSTPRGKSVGVRRLHTKIALALLRSKWPRAVEFNILFEEAIRKMGNSEEQKRKTLCSDLSEFYIRGAIEVHAWQGKFSTHLKEYPKLNDLALYQIGKGQPVVNPRHETIDLDAFSQKMLSMLDGTHTRLMLYDALRNMMNDHKILESSIDRILAKLPDIALLEE